MPEGLLRGVGRGLLSSGLRAVYFLFRTLFSIVSLSCSLFCCHPLLLVHPNALLPGPALSQGSPLSAELANRSGHSREHGSGPREVFRSGQWAQEAAEVGPQAHPAAAPRWAQRPSCLPLSDFTNSRRISLLKRGFVATPLQTNLQRLTATSAIKPKLVIKRSNW